MASRRCRSQSHLASDVEILPTSDVQVVLSADREKLRFGEPPLRNPKSFGFLCQKSADVRRSSCSNCQIGRESVPGADSTEGRMEEEPIRRKEEWKRSRFSGRKNSSRSRFQPFFSEISGPKRRKEVAILCARLRENIDLQKKIVL